MPLCNFLLTPALPKTLRVIKLILRGRKLPSLIRKLQHLSDLSAAVKSQGDCVQDKGLFTSVGSNFTNHSFWQWPPGLRLNPDTLLAGSQGPSDRLVGGSGESQSKVCRQGWGQRVRQGEGREIRRYYAWKMPCASLCSGGQEEKPITGWRHSL